MGISRLGIINKADRRLPRSRYIRSNFNNAMPSGSKTGKRMGGILQISPHACGQAESAQCISKKMGIDRAIGFT